ncbi:MAG: hypothetical protein NTW21_11465 [Verrucomicrobia bacterium]|nr:hypothetical protein [Verrucomicrobiota bacterium]
MARRRLSHDLTGSDRICLLYRNFAVGEVVRNASGKTRAARIDAAIAQALAGFFR